jgi:hypothetical protein
MCARAVTPRDQQSVLVRPATGIQERTRVARHALTHPRSIAPGKSIGRGPATARVAAAGRWPRATQTHNPTVDAERPANAGLFGSG